MDLEQFTEWREHPITKEIFEALRETREMDIQSLVSGNTLCTDPGETAQLTARIVGKIEGLTQLIDIGYEAGEDNEEDV